MIKNWNLILSCCFSIGLLLTVSSCTAPKTIQSNMTQEKSYRYGDGSGNSYTITANSIEYHPMTPEESSSGTYSGGEPAKKKLSKDDFKRVEAAVQAALDNKSIHITQRVMMSGSILVTEGEKSVEYIIKPHSKEQKALEKLLKELIGNS
jgi:hypothetical protein